MPSNAELLQLQDAVLARYPKLANFSGRDGEELERKYFKSFCAAFRALGAMKRTDAVDKKHYASHWGGECEILLRSWGIHVDICEAFLSAVIAHGDILFSDWQADAVVLELSRGRYRRAD